MDVQNQGSSMLQFESEAGGIREHSRTVHQDDAAFISSQIDPNMPVSSHLNLDIAGTDLEIPNEPLLNQSDLSLQEDALSSQLGLDINGDTITQQLNLAMQDDLVVSNKMDIESRNDSENDGVLNDKDKDENASTDSNIGLLNKGDVREDEKKQNDLVTNNQQHKDLNPEMPSGVTNKLKQNSSSTKQGNGTVSPDENEKKRFKCELCSTTVASKKSLKRHVLTHTKVTEKTGHKCEVCQLIVRRKSELKRHMIIHTKVTEKTGYKCEICQLIVRQKRDFEDHLRTHKRNKGVEGSDDIGFKCELCPATVSRKRDLKNHMRIHTGEEPYSCEVCGKTFKARSNRNVHMMQHQPCICLEDDPHCMSENCIKKDCTKIDTKPVTEVKDGMKVYVYRKMCEICGKICSSSSGLQQHMGIHRRAGKLCECKSQDEADYCTSVSCAWKQQDSVSSLYLCRICNHECVARCTLIAHLKIHVRENLYLCVVCHKRFKGPSNLLDHYKTVHKTITDKKLHNIPSSTREISPICKAVTCMGCEMECPSVEDLYKHMEIHTNLAEKGEESVEIEKKVEFTRNADGSYTCLICSKIIRTSIHNHLKAHRRWRKKKVLTCRFCSRTFNKASTRNTHLVTHKEEIEKLNNTRYENADVETDTTPSEQDQNEMEKEEPDIDLHSKVQDLEGSMSAETSSLSIEKNQKKQSNHIKTRSAGKNRIDKAKNKQQAQYDILVKSAKKDKLIPVVKRLDEKVMEKYTERVIVQKNDKLGSKVSVQSDGEKNANFDAISNKCQSFTSKEVPRDKSTRNLTDPEIPLAKSSAVDQEKGEAPWYQLRLDQKESTLAGSNAVGLMNQNRTLFNDSDEENDAHFESFDNVGFGDSSGEENDSHLSAVDNKQEETGEEDTEKTQNILVLKVALNNRKHGEKVQVKVEHDEPPDDMQAMVQLYSVDVSTSHVEQHNSSQINNNPVQQIESYNNMGSSEMDACSYNNELFQAQDRIENMGLWVGCEDDDTSSGIIGNKEKSALQQTRVKIESLESSDSPEDDNTMDESPTLGIENEKSAPKQAKVNENEKMVSSSAPSDLLQACVKIESFELWDSCENHDAMGGSFSTEIGNKEKSALKQTQGATESLGLWGGSENDRMAESSTARRRNKKKSLSKQTKKYVCSKKNVSQSELKTNKANKDLTCSVCNKTFKQKQGLKQHSFTHADIKPFSCEICDIQFASGTQLKYHNYRHNGQAPFHCKVCKKGFGTKSRLDEHQRLHYENYDFQCQHCGQSFKTKHNLRVHIRNQHPAKNTVYKCSFCDKTFTRRDSMTMHRRRKHGSMKSVCEVCGKEFPSSFQLNVHVRCHNGEKPYECEKCHKTFAYKHGLMQHKWTHAEKKPYRCEICDVGFNTGTQLKYHNYRHEGQTPHNCKVCDKGFTTLSRLQEHERSHSDIYNFKCLVCGKPFKTRGNLNAHKRLQCTSRPYCCEKCSRSFITIEEKKNHAITCTVFKKSFLCPHCSCTFATEKDLQSHLKTHQNGSEPEGETERNEENDGFLSTFTHSEHSKRPSDVFRYDCSLCTKKFRSKEGFRLHVKSSHCEKKMFQCAVCRKSFGLEMQLIKHTKIHMEKKGFDCPECGKSYAQKYNLEYHLRTHTNEKPYLCGICGARFKGIASYNYHMAVHLDDKQYGCGFCEKRFVNKQGLVVHERTHTGYHPYSCPVCDKEYNSKHSLQKHQKSYEHYDIGAEDEEILYNMDQETNVEVENKTQQTVDKAIGEMGP